MTTTDEQLQPVGQRPAVLVLTSTFPRWSGDSVPPFVFELCRRMAASLRVHVVAPSAPGSAASEQMEGIAVTRFRYAPGAWQTLCYKGGMLARLRENPVRALLVPGFLAAQRAAVRRTLAGGHFDVVHAHWVLPQGWVAAQALRNLRRRPRLLCTTHGSDLLALRSRFFRSLQRRVLAASDAVTGVGPEVCERARALAPAGTPVHNLPMGTDLRTRFVPGSPSREDEHLLFVGRMVEGKGVTVLLRVLAELSRRWPRLRLTLVGEGPARGRFAAQAGAIGIADRVRFVGALPNADLVDFYRRASALLLPSLSEGFGLVLVEALGCECPVIASDLPATREIIEHGVSGQLVPPGDAAALLQAIDATLAGRDSARAMAAAGRERALRRFDWQPVTDAYVNLVHRLVQQR